MGKKICILEDDEAILEVIGLLLAGEAYEVSGFASVSDFIKGNKGDLPDLFLLDVMLPDGSGIDVCGLLKSSSLTRHIPVLMMSAHSSKSQIQLSCEAQGFVSKPFDIYDLLEKVELAMAS